MTTTNEPRARPRAFLSPEIVRRLSRISAPRATLAVAETLAKIAALVFLAVWARSAPVTALCALALVAQYHALAVLAHDAAHQRMYEARWLNDLVGRLCGIPVGLSIVNYRMLHRIHHNHLYSEIDPDLALMAGYPRGRAYLARKLLKDVCGLTTVKTLLYFLGSPPPRVTDGGEKVGALDRTSDAMRAAAARDRKVVIVALLAAIAISIATGTWKWALALWVLPLFTVFQAVLRFRAILEHGAVPDTRNVLRATRTNLGPWYVRWLLFPHSVNYHVEHHLYPSVPHYRLAECHAELVRAGLLDHAEVATTIRPVIAKIFAPRIA